MNRPTMDGKSGTNVSNRLGAAKTAANDKRRPLLSARNDKNKCPATTSAAAKSKAEGTKAPSIINKKGGLKDRVDIIVKKKNKLLADTRELNDEINNYNIKIEELSSSDVQLRYEKALEELEDEKEEFDKINALFNTAQSNFNDINLMLANEVESTNKTMERIKDLKDKYEDDGKQMIKYDLELSNLKVKDQELDVALKTMRKEVQGMQNISYDIFADIKGLHNDIYNSKGNIQVVCRVRPMLKYDKSNSSYSIIYNNEYCINVGKTNMSQSLVNPKCKLTRKEFNFDKVLPPMVPIYQLFEEASCFISSALEGLPVYIILYGPEKSGKTYTLEGPEDEEKGLLHLMGDYMFENMKRLKLMGWNHQVSVQFSEVDDNNSNKLCTEVINSTKNLIVNYNLAKKQRQCDSLPFLMQIRIDDPNSQASSGSINVIEVSSESKSSKIVIQEALLAFAQNEEVKENLLLSNLDDDSKILVILNISPVVDQFCNCVEIMKFGNDIVANRVKHTKKQRG